MKYSKKFSGNVLIFICYLLSALIIVTVVIGLCVQNAGMPKLLGNNPEAIAYLNKNTDPNDFTFIVIGDVKGGTATFEAMLDIMAPEKPAFAVVLGDFVRHPQLIEHKLFALEVAEYINNMPMFLVVGNHDIGKNKDFSIEDFKKTYGAEQFSFVIGKNLFILLTNVADYGKTGKYLEFMEQTISKYRDKLESKFGEQYQI